MIPQPVQDVPVIPGAFPRSPSLSPPPDEGSLLVSSGSGKSSDTPYDQSIISNNYQGTHLEGGSTTGSTRLIQSLMSRRQANRQAPYSIDDGSRSSIRSSSKSNSYSALGTSTGILHDIRNYIRRLSSNGPLTPIDSVEPVTMSQKADESLSRIIYDAVTPDSPISPGFSGLSTPACQKGAESQAANVIFPFKFASPSVTGTQPARHLSLSALSLETNKINPLQGAGPVRETRSLSEITMISSGMSMTDVARHLGAHGCKDITDQLNEVSCTPHPVSGGGYGDVFRGSLHDDTPVAIKTIRFQSLMYLKHAAQELHTWSKCQHPNVVGLLGLVQFRGMIGMVSVWMDHGTMPLYLESHQETDRCRLSAQIAEGLAYLHENNIIHGDLKGQNVLISNDGVPMIADFGNAVLHGSSLRITGATAKHGISPRWTAPELFQDSESCLYSREADVYALGMTILEVITGKMPWPGQPDYVVMVLISVKKQHPKRPEDTIPPDSQYGNTLWWLLTLCWSTDPGDRPTAAYVTNTMKEITHERLTRGFGNSPG